jgi:hypothetical protein
MDPSSVATVDHESGLAQDAQVVRHERLADVEPDHQLAHRAFTGAEMLENPQARLVTERAKPQRGDGTGLFGAGGHNN